MAKRNRRRYLLSLIQISLAKIGFLLVFLVLLVPTSAALYYYIQFTHLIETRLRLQPPARKAIYARPFHLYVGQKLSIQQLEKSLQRSGYSPFLEDTSGDRYRIRGEIISFAHQNAVGDSKNFEVSFVAGLGGALRVAEIRQGNTSVREVFLKPQVLSNLFGAARQKQRHVKFEELPETLIDAVLAAEDEHFFWHPGLDWWAITRATVMNLAHWRPIQGGSTLTQQFVKNYFLTSEKTLRRKLEESYLAILLENRFSKEEILELYANQVYLGQAGSFSTIGFGQGAVTYFGKNLQDLTLAEAALLAGIIQAPNRYSPFRHPEVALQRRNYVLDLMQEKGLIGVRDKTLAQETPLMVLPASHQNYTEAPYFVDYVRELLEKDWGITADGVNKLEVYTTLDPDLQQAAFVAVNNGMAKVDRILESQKQGVEPQAALLAVDPRTGEVLALVGGRDYARSQYNRAVHARRQPGSAFKPLVYAAALQSGLDHSEAPIYTLSSLILDEPYTIHFEEKSYSPGNYGRRYHGPVTLRQALSLSLNVPTLKLAEEIGFNSVVHLSTELGLTNSVQPYPSVALGTFEVSLLELAQVYTAFTNQGRRAHLHPVTAYRKDGNLVKLEPQNFTPAIGSEVAFLINSALESALDEGTGQGVRAQGFNLPAAGKTGTSNDSWFVGYTPDLLSVVWIGLDNSEPLGLSGSQAALPIWTHFMLEAERLGYLSGKNFSVPENIVAVQIDSKTGLVASSHCQNVQTEYYVSGTEPVVTCFGEIPDREMVQEPRVHDRPKRGGLWGWIKRLF